MQKKAKSNSDKMSAPKISEGQLINEIMRALGKVGCVYRTNAGSFKLPNGKYFRGMPEGFADILFIRRDGVACFIETKVKPNKPSEKQLEFIEKMKRHNCKAGVAYSLDDALAICEIGDNQE